MAKHFFRTAKLLLEMTFVHRTIFSVAAVTFLGTAKLAMFVPRALFKMMAGGEVSFPGAFIMGSLVLRIARTVRTAKGSKRF